MNLALILGALRYLPAVTAAIPQVKALIDEAIATLDPADQATAKAAYVDLMAENDEGYARLDAKLAEAAKR